MKTKLLTALVIGETLLVSARKVAGNKVQLELAEIIPNPKRNSALSDLNADDERFSGGSKPRRTFATASPAIVDAAYGLKTSDLKEGEVIEDINILNPEIKGARLRVQIVETNVATEWQAANLEKAAKQFTNAKTGEVNYFVKGGKFIFSNPIVTNSEPVHSIMQSDELMSFDEATAAGVTYDEAAVVANVKPALNK